MPFVLRSHDRYRGMPRRWTSGPRLWGQSHPGGPFSAKLRTVTKRPRPTSVGPAVRPHLRLRSQESPTAKPSRASPHPKRQQPPCFSRKRACWAKAEENLGPSADWSPPPRRARQRLAAGRCQSPRPEPSPGKRRRARVLRLPPRPLKPVQLGELERAPPPPRLPTLPRRRRCRSCRRTPWRGGRENGARGGGGGGEVMLAPGMGQRQRSSSICATQAAASLWPEGQPSGGRPRAPRVRSGPAVRAPARGPPGLSLVVTRLFQTRVPGPGIQTRVFGTRTESPDARLGWCSLQCHSCSCVLPSALTDFNSAGMALCVHLRVWVRGLGHFAGSAVGPLLREPTSFRDPGWDGVNRMHLAQREGERTQRTWKSSVAR